jgi:hypothetical protein
MPVPPVYSPELVASAILKAAQSPQRDVYVGGAGFLFWLLQRMNPTLLDRVMILNNFMFKSQLTDEPDNGRDNLFQPIPEMGRVYGDFQSLTKPSLYTPIFEFSPNWLRIILSAVLPAIIMARLFHRNNRAPTR